MSVLIITAGKHRDPFTKQDSANSFTDDATIPRLVARPLKEHGDGVWSFEHDGITYELHDVVEVQRRPDPEPAEDDDEEAGDGEEWKAKPKAERKPKAKKGGA